MLLGEYTHSIDVKGRLAIPAKFRSHMSAGAIITRGLDKCLFVFDKGEWEKLVAKITALPIAHANSRAFGRLMLSGASDVDLDIQGRILVPEYLREYGELKKQVIITGLHTRMEVWDKTRWQEYKAKTEAESDQIAEKLGELGI